MEGRAEHVGEQGEHVEQVPARRRRKTAALYRRQAATLQGLHRPGIEKTRAQGGRRGRKRREPPVLQIYYCKLEV